MPSKVGARTERGSRPKHGAGTLEKEVERPGLLRHCPEAREMHGAKHTLLGTEGNRALGLSPETPPSPLTHSRGSPEGPGHFGGGCGRVRDTSHSDRT